MPTVIEYPMYRRSDITAGLNQRDPQALANEGEGYVGLSGFDIPQHIEVEVTSGGQMRVRFAYSDRAPADRLERQISTRPAVGIIVSRRAPRILEIRVDDAEYFFRELNAQLPLTAVRDLASAYSPRHQQVLLGSAHLVNHILKSIPDSFWRQVLKKK